MKNQLDLSFANYLFDYTISRSYYAKENPTNDLLKISIKDDYYDFVDRIDLNNINLLRSRDFEVFMNRFEFSELYAGYYTGPIRTFTDFYGYVDSLTRIQYKTSEIPLIVDVAKIRSLRYKIEHSDTEKKAQDIVQSAKASLAPVFFKEEATRLLKQHESKKTGYDLPNTANAAIFKKIIDKHKGKILIVDFWAQWCGPCRSGIERSLASRKKFKDNPLFDFVFITDINGTPDVKFFNDYNKQNFMVNSYRISEDDYRALRELFKFNGIPRYVLVDENGKIRNDNFENYNFNTEMIKHFPDKFTPDYFSK